MLAMKIDLKLSTMASFYENSAHIPMIIDAPVKSKRFLNPGSGMFYGWSNQDAEFSPNHPQSTIPIADTTLIKQGFQKIAESYPAKCQDKICHFRISGKAAGKSFFMDFNVPEHMVKTGYMPMWVPDTKAFKTQMDLSLIHI